jgi:hypothetical protein
LLNTSHSLSFRKSNTMEQDTCPICLETLKRKVSLVPCSHKFCVRCIDQWQSRNNSCPVCRTQISFQTAHDPIQSRRRRHRRRRIPTQFIDRLQQLEQRIQRIRETITLLRISISDLDT